MAKTTTATGASLPAILDRMATGVTAGGVDGLTDALAAIEEGARLYPDAAMPADANWDALRTALTARLDGQRALAAQVAQDTAQDTEHDAQAEESVPPAAEPAQTAAPRMAKFAAATMTHGEHGTVLRNTPFLLRYKVSAALNRKVDPSALGWTFNRVLKAWVLNDSAGQPLDSARVAQCVAAMSALGIDVIDETAAPKAARKTAPKAETATAPKAAPEPVAEPAPTTGLAALDIDTLIALVKAGDPDAAAEMKGRMLGQTAPKTAPKTARKAAPRAEYPADGPVQLAFGYAEDANVKRTAQSVRKALYAQVTTRHRASGVEIHVNDGRTGDGRMTVTITMCSATAQVRKSIITRVRNVALEIAGVTA